MPTSAFRLAAGLTLVLAGIALGCWDAPVQPGTEEPLSVTHMSPNSGPESGGVTVTIVGSGFRPQTSVTFGGIPSTSVVAVDSGLIEAIAPPHVMGEVEVIVTSPGRGRVVAGRFVYYTLADCAGCWDY